MAEIQKDDIDRIIRLIASFYSQLEQEIFKKMFGFIQRIE
jgi:hypothetical protein